MEDSKKRILEQLADLSFFRIYIEIEIGNNFDSLFSKDELNKMDKNKIIKVKNNDSILTLENWEQHKETFFAQRMATYEDGETLTEKIEIELNVIEELPINKRYYKTLKDRYKEYLKVIQPHPITELSVNNEELTQRIDKEQNNTLSNLITNQNCVEIIEGIKIHYKNIRGKRLKLLLLALQELELLPKDRIVKKFYDCCKEEFNWSIASYNAMNGYTFNDVVDTKEFDSMKQYLTTLLKP